MTPEKKKSGLALVIEMGKGKKDAEGDEPDGDESDDGSYSAAVDELADALGVADDKREEFTEAFKAAVMSCK